MKSKPSWPEYRIFYPLKTRWLDNDMYGHVNNVIYYSFFDSVINQYLIEKAGLDIRRDFVVGYMVNSGCSYHAQLSYPDLLEIGLRVEHLGNSSVRYGLAVFKEGETLAAAHGHMVHVFVDRSANRSVTIPPNIRQALEAIFIQEA